MASQADIDQPPMPRRRVRRGCWTVLVVLLLVVAIAAAALWVSREKIANNVIAGQLKSLGIPATYDIESIGGTHEVLRNLVIGNPQKPDLTVARAEVFIRYRLGLPAIREIRLTKPRLYGTYTGGKLSFGALDPLIFGGPKQAFQLPNLALRVVDGRGLLESDYGPVGFKLVGNGNLQDGFAGELAATAPKLTLPGCALDGATLYGRIGVTSQRPAFSGPVRLASLACPGQRLSLKGTALQLAAHADKALAVFEGDANLRTGQGAYGASTLAALAGDTTFTWRDGGLTARYKLAGTALDTPQVAAARLDLDGTLRARRQFERIEFDANVDGQGIRVGRGLDASIAAAARATGDTLLGPILEKVRSALSAESWTSRLIAQVQVRSSDGNAAIVVPEASLRGNSGATLLSLSRMQISSGQGGTPRFNGNFATGGAGLPQIVGRMEQSATGALQLRLTMAEYQAGRSQLAIPQLLVTQSADGSFGFTGQARASGALPGGFAQNLLLPVNGTYSSARGLALWTTCTDFQFDQLHIANLTLDRRSLTLCPASGAPIVRYGPGGLKIAAGAPSVALAGRLGQTPIAIRSGPIGLAYPGAVSARQLVVTLGPADTATSFAISNLTANIGKDIAGRFDGTDVKLYAVPLDLVGASGNWRYAGGRLTLADGAFTLQDRQDPVRFNPLTAESATLALENNLINAQALLRDPVTGRDVTRVDIVHNLANARGHADLNVPGLVFDNSFQPRNLTERAFGVVSNVRGTVTGTGRIDWTERGVTSTGRFSSDALDFAAAFGPVKGASGTVEFSDLLGLTTAPNQMVHVKSVNPGIEVTDGDVLFQLRGGEVLALQGATWPFMGGTLTMRPVDIRFGAKEERRYVLEIEGLDLALFVQRFGLENLVAKGIFDGTVPVVFDAEGNGHLTDGLLLSRPPGGNISYIGELTYENLGAMANMAFAALRSLDFTQMSVGIDGDLSGEIITRLRLDGVSQGEGAAHNIATRAIAGLPIRFDINIRAQFFSLFGNLRSLYDPAAVADPRSPGVGLLDQQGNVLQRESRGQPEPVTPNDLIPNEPPIQRRESEEVP